MMMLAVSNLMSSAVMTGVACALSPASCRTPSRNPCMVRVAATRYRNEPYGFRVLPPSPMSAAALEAAAAPVAPVAAAAYVMPASFAPAPMTPAPTSAAAAFTAVSASRRPAPVTPVAAPVAARAVHAAAAPAAAAATRYAYVDFKYESKTFVAPFKIAVGDVVVVEGDRGENIGTVAEITTEAPAYAVPCKVVRRATARDLEQLAAQREKEAAAVKLCQAAVESLGLRATVVDCEYQFDLNKLQIFVRRATRNAFVDFRKLQRGLFRDFRCRIWLSYMDEVEEARAAPRFQ